MKQTDYRPCAIRLHVNLEITRSRISGLTQHMLVDVFDLTTIGHWHPTDQVE